MLGKLVKGSTTAATTGAQRFDLLEATRVRDAAELPMAPVSAFRKRPVKLHYDKNEFHMFRLPSEDHFLLSSFDRSDLFGKRKGIQHSPHIKAQQDLDTRLLWLIGGAMIFMTFTEFKPHHDLKALRENFRNGHMGKFTVEDFK